MYTRSRPSQRFVQTRKCLEEQSCFFDRLLSRAFILFDRNYHVLLVHHPLRNGKKRKERILETFGNVDEDILWPIAKEYVPHTDEANQMLTESCASTSRLNSLHVSTFANMKTERSVDPRVPCPTSIARH